MLWPVTAALLAAGPDTIVFVSQDRRVTEAPAALGVSDRDTRLFKALWLDLPHAPLEEKPIDGWPPELADAWKEVWTTVQEIAAGADRDGLASVATFARESLWQRYLAARKSVVREIVVSESAPRPGETERQVTVSISSYAHDSTELKSDHRSTPVAGWATVAQKLLADARAGQGAASDYGSITDLRPLGVSVVGEPPETALTALKRPDGCVLPAVLDVAPPTPIAEALRRRWAATAGGDHGLQWCTLKAYEHLGQPPSLFRQGLHSLSLRTFVTSLACGNRVSIAIVEDGPGALGGMTHQLLAPHVAAACAAKPTEPVALDGLPELCRDRRRVLPATLALTPDNGTAHSLADAWRATIKGGEGSLACVIEGDEALGGPPKDKKAPVVRKVTVSCAGHHASADVTRSQGKTNFAPLVAQLARLHCGEIVP
jgi:hypothetical protein